MAEVTKPHFSVDIRLSEGYDFIKGTGYLTGN